MLRPVTRNKSVLERVVDDLVTPLRCYAYFFVLYAYFTCLYIYYYYYYYYYK